MHRPVNHYFFLASVAADRREEPSSGEVVRDCGTAMWCLACKSVGSISLPGLPVGYVPSGMPGFPPPCRVQSKPGANEHRLQRSQKTCSLVSIT